MADKTDETTRSATDSWEPWTPDDAVQWSVRERLAALAGYTQHMTPENMAALKATYTHTIVVAYFEKLAYDYGWVSPRVDWPAWMNSEAAMRLQPEAVLAYELDDLVTLITAMVRFERFGENTLAPTLYRFAHVITACAARLLAELDSGAPLKATLFNDVPRRGHG